MRTAFFAALLAAASLGAGAQSTPDDVNTETQKALKEARAAKPAFGIKAGYNVAKVSGRSANFSPDAKNGFTAAAFFSPRAKGGLGYRTELVFSRQGFEFAEGGKTTAVTNDYVYMPHFTTFGIGTFLQLHVGAQMGYLLKSSKATAAETKDITSFAERLDYGAAAGAEVYLLKHLILGGRYNVSFGNAYKRLEASATTPSVFPLPFNPAEVKGKNAVINFFVGLRL